MVNLTQLRTFLYAAENLSFTEAARYLHVTQPTVSHHIKMLEEDFGVQLFQRSGTQLRLSEGGRLLLPWARRLIRDSIQLEEMMGSLEEGIVGQLRIACSTTAGKYILPQLAARFSQRYPGVKVNIPSCTPEHVVPRLLQGEANLGVLSYEIRDQDLELQLFFEDVINLIVPPNHPWALRESIEPAELLDEQILIREPTSGTRKVMLAELAKHDISLDDLNVFMQLGNAEAIVRTVAAGYGVSFVSNLASACPVERGSVVPIPVEGLDLRRDIYMVRKSLETPYRPQEAFWSFIHDPANADILKLAARRIH